MEDLAKIFSFNSIEKSVESVSDSIPVKLELPSVNSKNTLEDCSKYKNGIRDGTDMEEALVALQKTKACEQRNNQIKMKYALEDTIKSNNISLQTTPNKIKLSKAERQFTQNDLIFIENSRFNEIKFTVTVSLNITYDKITMIEGMKMFLIDENSKKYTMNMMDCGPPMGWINGKTTDSVTFMTCYDVGKEVQKLDLMYMSYGPSSINVKFGTIQIKN